MVGTSTARLNLYKPDPNDFVNVSTDLNANMDKIDLAVPLLQELEAVCSADTTINTGAPADVTGATLTFNTTVANAIAKVEVTWDWRLTATGTGYCYGEINVDGTVEPTRKALFLAQNAETRLPGFTSKKFVLAAPGSHTIKLQCHKDIAAGTALFCGGTTVLSVDLTQ